MSTLEDFMGKVSESNVSDEEILRLLDLTDAYAEEHFEDPDIFIKAAEVRAALIGKMNNKDIVYDKKPEQSVLGGESTGQKKSLGQRLEEFGTELKELRELENNPTAYMKKCEEILQNPPSRFLAGEAIYGVGKIVENNPNPEVVSRAISVLRCCTDNEELIKLDERYPNRSSIGNAMKFTVEKIENCPVKSSAWKASGYERQYLNDWLHMAMGDVLEQMQYSEREVTQMKVTGQPLGKDSELPLEFRQWEAKQKKEQKDAVYPKMVLDEDKLPQLRLAGNAGKDSVIFDLNSIAEDLKALKPGESLALGRAPKEVGVQGKIVKVGEDNNYVSRHHCDIRRNVEGKLELVDRSMNGTEILKGGKDGVNLAFKRIMEKSGR